LEADLAHAQKMESIGQLAAGVAHEINTPNQYIGDNIRFLEESFSSVHEAIDAYRALHEEVLSTETHPELAGRVTETIERTDLEFVLEEVPRSVTQALEGVDRVASIVRAMKEFSHPGQEAVTTVDLNRVVDSTVTVARNEWKDVSTVEMDLDPHLPQIEGHPGALGQVVLNLIINAVHAIKDRFDNEPQGLIRIATHCVGDWVELTISDNGCGIPEHAQSRIFEPFYTTKDIGLGTGQGLAISHGVICEKHGGHIEFTTEVNVGTTFTLRLPTQESKEEAA
jgi:signal transduction histidine kinase